MYNAVEQEAFIEWK